MLQDQIGIDLGKLLREKLAGIVASERLQIEHQHVLAVVSLDLDTIRGSKPIGLTARQDEERIVDG